MNKKNRTRFLVWLYDHTQTMYRKLFKKKKRAWQFTETQLLYFAEDSLGRKLGEFYKKHGFRMISKMENHDVYHLITENSTKIEDEIAMQYLLLGNGKRSAYLCGVILLGTLVFPEYWKSYKNAFLKGRKMRVFHNWDFEDLLSQNFHSLQAFINRNSSSISLNSSEKYCIK